MFVGPCDHSWLIMLLGNAPRTVLDWAPAQAPTSCRRKGERIFKKKKHTNANLLKDAKTNK